MTCKTLQSRFLLLPKILFPLFAITAVSTMAVGCSKDKDANSIVVTESRSYPLLNVSGGTSANAGTVTITKLADGKASLNVNLATAYRVNGVTLKASITTISGVTELMYSDLGNIDGTSGQATFSPVLILTSGLAVSYNELIAKTGYFVKIWNGATVQGTATIN